jgi:hypothetical protein
LIFADKEGKMENLISRVTIIAVGNDNYQDQHFQRLYGVKNDLDNIKYLFINNKTAIFKDKQYIELFNCDSNSLRKAINDYILSRSADNDILIFYFSGHGVAIGRNDFGFCTTDTIIHLIANVVLPSSVFTFSELLNSLYISNIVPIIIIDACYSGAAGKNLIISPIEAIATMRDQLHNLSASSFALLCSCSDNQQSLETINGGIFSTNLIKISTEGIFPKDKYYLSLLDFFQELIHDVYNSSYDAFPRLFIGATLPVFPICKNPSYSPQTYALVKHLVDVLLALWNGGENRYLTPKEIDEICGKGAYGNHNKLSLSPWSLVEDVPNSKKRTLSKRGIDFINGTISIPQKIIQDPKTGIWQEVKGTRQVFISEFNSQDSLF